jgi:Transposase IS116/IS110/IS902 family
MAPTIESAVPGREPADSARNADDRQASRASGPASTARDRVDSSRARFAAPATSRAGPPSVRETHESAGKHKSGKTRKGNRRLRTALIEAAAGASRVKNSALQARFRRVLRHRGPKKAVVAVAHALLRAACHVLADHADYRGLGADYYGRQHSQRVMRRAIHLLECQGSRVTLEPAA